MISHNNNSLTLLNEHPSEKLKGYQLLVFFSMLFISIMICNAILTNRYVLLTEHVFVLGGTLTSPLVFILGDIIAEIFGYKIAKQLIWCGFICLAFFTGVCWLVSKAPYPIFFSHYDHYDFVFGQLPYIVLSSFIAFIVSSLINIYIITRWKILLQGRYFWLRSLGSSTIAEGLYTFIAIVMMEINAIPLSKVWNVILISYAIKIAYSIIFAGPGNLLVNYIKYHLKIDITEYPTIYNPFKTKGRVCEPN